jgi:copper chaperone NosL
METVAGKLKTGHMIVICGFVILSLMSAQGEKKCSYCEMFYQFPNFGGEIITKKNDTIWYDASECLASVVAREFIKKNEIKSIRSMNYLKPGEWIDNNKAYFLVSEKIHSPMSVNISAYKNSSDVKAQQKKFGGEILRWTDVVALVNKRWFKK